MKKNLLRGLALIVFGLGSAWALGTATNYNTAVAGSTLTAAWLNNLQSHYTALINAERAYFPGTDSLKIKYVLPDTLKEKSVGSGVVVVGQLKSASTADSLVYRRGRVAHLGGAGAADTVGVDSLTMAAGGLFDFADGSRGHIGNVHIDSAAVDSITIAGLAKVLAGVRVVFSDGSSADIPRVQIDSLYIAGVRYTGTAANLNTLRDDSMADALHRHSELSAPDGSPDRALVIDAAGSGYVGDNANASSTIGWTINQGANDNEIFSLKSTDVAHGVTTVTETDTYFSISKSTGATGGAFFRGFNGGAGNIGIEAHAYSGTPSTTKSTSGYGAFNFQAVKINGTGGAALGTDTNVLSLGTNGTSRFIFDAEGTGHADDVWTDNAFDLAESYDVFYLPTTDGFATRRAKYWSDKDSSWVAEVDTVSIKAGVPTKAEEGTVLTVDATHDNRLTPTSVAYQVVAGIVSYHTAQLGNAMGGIMEKYPQLALHDPANPQPVALVGIVPTKLTNDNGDIKRGDVLVAANRDGFAMKMGTVPDGVTLTSRHIVGIALMECAQAECFGNVQR